MKNKFRLLKPIIKLSFMISLSTTIVACGGGSGGSASNEINTSQTTTSESKPDQKPTPIPPENIDYVQVKGQLSTFGDVFSPNNARIDAKCMNQTGFKQSVSTNALGEWAGEVDRAQLPCKIKATATDNIYYSYLTEADKSLRIDALSSYLVVHATKQLPEDWYASLGQLNTNQINDANMAIRNELIAKKYDVDADSDADFLHSNYYDLFDDLKESVNKSEIFDGYYGLVKLLQQGKLNAIPLAPEDFARLNIKYSVCSGTEYQGSTQILTHCSQDLLPDFKSSKLVQKDKSLCEIQKNGEELVLKSKGQEYRVKINGQANDKITNGYPTMNTLTLAEGKQRVELVFQYDLLIIAAASRLNSEGDMVDIVECK